MVYDMSTLGTGVGVDDGDGDTAQRFGGHEVVEDICFRVARSVGSSDRMLGRRGFGVYCCSTLGGRTRVGVCDGAKDGDFCSSGVATDWVIGRGLALGLSWLNMSAKVVRDWLVVVPKNAKEDACAEFWSK